MTEINRIFGSKMQTLQGVQKPNSLNAAKQTISLGGTNKVDTNDFYGGMVQLSNRQAPTYTGPESMGQYFDYLENLNCI